MPRLFTLLFVLMLSTISSAASAQQYESFRFVGEMPSVSAGTVTSLEITDSSSNPTARLSFLNAAGLSTVYDVKFAASAIIRAGLPVFMPSDDFGQGIEPSMNLENVRFLTAKLVHPEDPEATPPAHWFRMTLHNNVWSGVFRVAGRVYSINRLNRDNVIEVRTTGSSNTRFQPSRQVKVTALIDEEYVHADAPDDALGMDSLGHLFALESMHVMDGLATDSLDVTLRVEQLIYRNSIELTSADEPTSAVAGASNWLSKNGEAFGVRDNLATFIFRGSEQIVTGSAGSDFTVQGKSDHYQFESARYFGKLIGLPDEDNTLQSQPARTAHWSEAQSTFLENNPLPAAVTQTLSYDAPVIEVTEAPESDPIPQYILDSESEEISDQNLAQNTDKETGGPGLQDDATTNTPNSTGGGNSGGGALNSVALLALLISLFHYRRRA